MRGLVILALRDEGLIELVVQGHPASIRGEEPLLRALVSLLANALASFEASLRRENPQLWQFRR